MESVQATTSETGWDRLRKFYTDEICFERELVLKSTKVTFLASGLIGGFAGRKEANRRLQAHTTGLTFPSPSLRVTRSWDYKMLSFMKNGFRWGFRSTILIGTITMATTHLTLYRDRFNGWYAPIISGAASFIAHGASGMFAVPLGIYGCLQAAMLGSFVGTTVSASAFLYALYLDGTIDDAYHRFRSDFEAELKDLKIYQSQIIKIMKAEKLWFTWQARSLLKKKEADKDLGQFDDYEEVEDKSKI